MTDRRRWVLFSLIATLTATLIIPGLRAQKSSPENSLYGTTREWPMAGGDLGNQRYSTLTQINLQTITRLGGAWMSEDRNSTRLNSSHRTISYAVFCLKKK